MLVRVRRTCDVRAAYNTQPPTDYHFDLFIMYNYCTYIPTLCARTDIAALQSHKIYLTRIVYTSV